MTREECEAKILEKLEEVIAIADEYCDGKCEYLACAYFNKNEHCDLTFNNNYFDDEHIKRIRFYKEYNDVKRYNCNRFKEEKYEDIRN